MNTKIKLVNCVTTSECLSRICRLTDLDESQLTRFYGQEDFNTLENLLHNISHILPATSGLPVANNNNNNNTADDDKVQQQQQLDTIHEDDRSHSRVDINDVNVSIHQVIILT